jgi:hypothetical protein
MVIARVFSVLHFLFSIIIHIFACNIKILMDMTTVFINDQSRIGRRILKYIEQHPRVAQIADERDNMPLPVPEVDLVSIDEF